MILLLPMTAMASQVTPGATIDPSEPNSPFVEVRPNPHTRRRLCPDRLVLYICNSRLARKGLTAQTRSLANVLHRPVIGYAWPKTLDALGGPDVLAARQLRSWFEGQKDTKTSVEVITHGKGTGLANRALRGAALPEGRITLYAMGWGEELTMPKVEVWRLVGDRVIAPSKTRSTIKSDDGTPGKAADKSSFEDYLQRLQKDVYGKVLDPLLRSPETMRYPYRPDLLEWRIVAHSSYAGRPGLPLRERFDIDEEKRRLDKWLATPRNRNRIDKDPQSISLFNRLTAAKGGPKHWFLMWYPMDRKETPAWKENAEDAREQGLPRWAYERHSAAHENFLPINMHEDAILASDLDPESLLLVSDQIGRAALSYAILPDRAKAYSDLTHRSINRNMAIALRGRVILAPTIMSRILGKGQISGAFSNQQIQTLIKDIKARGLNEPTEEK